MLLLSHSVPGIFCVFSFFFPPNGTEKHPSLQEVRAEKSLREGFHSETPRPPLGAETRGARVGGSA